MNTGRHGSSGAKTPSPLTLTPNSTYRVGPRQHVLTKKDGASDPKLLINSLRMCMLLYRFLEQRLERSPSPFQGLHQGEQLATLSRMLSGPLLEMFWRTEKVHIRAEISGRDTLLLHCGKPDHYALRALLRDLFRLDLDLDLAATLNAS